jgi:hypothetical protein
MSDYDDLVGDLVEEFQEPKVLPELVAGRVVHVDGDILAYNCAGNDEVPPPIARRNLLARIDNLKLLAGAERIVVHLTSPLSDKGKRFEIAKTQAYQEQRTHSQRPKNWAYLREVMESFAAAGHPEYKSWTDREADDAMSAAAWAAHRIGRPDLCVISSHDKDLRQAPGWYVDWTTGELRWRIHGYIETSLDVEKTTLKQGAWFHGIWFLLYQMLAGDSTDHIPGLKTIPGHWLLDNLPEQCNAKARAGKELPKDKPCGPALAAKILMLADSDKPSEGYELVKAMYHESIGNEWEDYFKEQWRLLALYYYDNDMRMQLARDIRDKKFDT